MAQPICQSQKPNWAQVGDRHEAACHLAESEALATPSSDGQVIEA